VSDSTGTGPRSFGITRAPTARSGLSYWLGSKRGLLLVLALWSLVPLAVLFVSFDDGVSIGARGRVFTGSDSPDVADLLQYLAWIRDSGEHVLLSNRFDIRHDPHLFLHPMFALSGLAWALGVSLQVALLAWKPVLVVVMFVGFAAYVRRLIPADGWSRAAALFAALFFYTPAAALVGWLGLGDGTLRFGMRTVAWETFAGGYLSSHLALVVGLMPLFLLGIERLANPARRAGRSTAWYSIPTAAAGLLVSWLHPWQGLTLLLLVGGVVVWGRLWNSLRVLVIPVAATAAPLAYFFALSHTQSSWNMVSKPNHFSHFGLWLVLGLVPALLVAAVGLRGRDLDIQERILRLWPAAALIVYFGLSRSWFYHALAGISLPLSILAVRGWLRLRLPAPVAALAVAAFTVPGAALWVHELHHGATTNFIPRSEADAVDYLSTVPRPGGVLAREPLGTAVPVLSDRQTWVGHPTWTPAWTSRSAQADALFSGRLGAAAARALVRRTTAQFVISDCGRHVDLKPLLGPLVERTRPFGCAAVYELKSTSTRSPS
jgi:hypothetical protein